MSHRNAEPETVALAVLDVCERAVRDCSPQYNDKSNTDAQFMKRSIEGIKSRIRMLKGQAAALWRPDFTRMLEQCHSIAVESIDYNEKEAVRTEKMKCMACGRWERCCKYALSCAGPFNHEGFNGLGVERLDKAFSDFYKGYSGTAEGVTEPGSRQLLAQDMGEFTIGSTCLRKAELYYLVNTLLMECCYEAYHTFLDQRTETPADNKRWFYATADNVDVFTKKLEDLELAIADEKRAVPNWGADEVLWENIEKARYNAADGDEEGRLDLLRKRAEQTLRRMSTEWEEESEDGDEEEEEEDDAVQLSEQESEEDDDRGQPARCQGSTSRRKSRAVLDSEDEGENHEPPSPCEAAPKNRRKRPPSVEPARKSRRQQKLSPELESACVSGPHEEGTEQEEEEKEEEENEPEEEAAQGGEATLRGCEYEMARRSRAPPPNAFHMAQEQRAPGGRLPARRRCLFNLGTLQLRLIREGRDSDSAICTTAMFTIQELLAKIDELSHTVE